MDHSTTAPLRSTARVPTPRGERWVRQLAAHLGHKAEVSELDGGQLLRLPSASCAMTWDETGLTFDARADDAEGLERVQRVVGGHLERFAAKEGLQVAWG